MRSQDTPFEGGPMDGRVLPVLLGITGHPPKTYRIPVPAPGGGPPTVLVYRRVPRGRSGRIGLSPGWKYLYDPAGATAADRPRWPWSGRTRTPAADPDATPRGKPDDADG
ncbi:MULTISPECIES: hypothetical protein [Streptomyces]|uniref:Uncharacterized protein n=1 Tax=Streptomyces prasinus TaxID=67345 RepID=A0ABX6B8W0_9ACTN|nr:hypothetical protein [Streptomyces prasinus]QEV10479.1 hypothetical protein CP972_24175 [Streptomyces prasinus]